LATRNTNKRKKVSNFISNIKSWSSLNSSFLIFMIRFGSSFVVLALAYEAYLNYTESIGDLDLVTYYISRGTFEFSKFIGVADCEWSCFYDGCRVGREGRMINIIEGCNGLMLAITYSAYIIGIGGFTKFTNSICIWVYCDNTV